MTLSLGLFASHGGSNLQAILDACEAGEIDALPAVVISNNSKSRALERAREAGVPTVHLSSATHPDPDTLDAAILAALKDNGVELVVLAGYMKALGPRTVEAYRNRIINLHGAPLPRFGGPGMYGDRMHEAVLASGIKMSAVTIHLVDEEYDQGPVIAVTPVPVLDGDTTDDLSARIKAQEHRLYVQTIARIASGELELPAQTG